MVSAEKPPGPPSLSRRPGRQGWRVLSEDLPLPVCVLRETALETNLATVAEFCASRDVWLAPHGKTSMSPELFGRQLAHGAWGLTVATGHQLRVARAAGVRRVLYANQLLGRADIAFLAGELRSDPDFAFWCLVDSVDSVRLLAGQLQRHQPGRPVPVLVEVGFPGGRCGVRDLATGLAVAEAVRDAPELRLAGVEGFEGLLQYGDPDGRAADVRGFLGSLAELAVAVDDRGLFDADPVLVSAGGSAFFDLVAEALASLRLNRPTRLVMRSGCYLAHDGGLYDRMLTAVHDRLGTGELTLQPALEVWCQVLSVPEPGLVILSAGRRDFGQDAGNPEPRKHCVRGSDVVTALSGWEVAAVSDQHAHVRAPVDHRARVGDLVGLVPSHPCTTFDKWRLIYLVDDAYAVTGAVRTWF